MPREKVMSDKRIVLSVTPELKEWISEFRFAKKIPTEAEAMRLLFEQALEASGTPRPGKAKTKK
jgi:hypothetical protein